MTDNTRQVGHSLSGQGRHNVPRLRTFSLNVDRHGGTPAASAIGSTLLRSSFDS
jgi:hypothetical protein